MSLSDQVRSLARRIANEIDAVRAEKQSKVTLVPDTAAQVGDIGGVLVFATEDPAVAEANPNYVWMILDPA